MRRIAQLLLALALALAAGIFIVWSNTAHAPTQESSPAAKTTDVWLGSGHVWAEIVDTPESRSRGLSGRPSLDEGTGMLFVFEEDGMHGFWMKDMNFPIDMLWLDADKKIIFIAAGVPPESYPQTFAPSAPARYVLEVPAGWAERNGVRVGDTARF